MGMRSTTALVLVLVLLIQLGLGEAATVSNGTTDGKERWGYVEIHPSNLSEIYIPPFDLPHLASKLKITQPTLSGFPLLQRRIIQFSLLQG